MAEIVIVAAARTAVGNFSGSFGILDSGRTDVAYEQFYGHSLDCRYLELLQRY